MALSAAAGTYGFRVGKELTHAGTSLLKAAPKVGKVGIGETGKALGAAGKIRGAAKLTAGSVGGLVTGAGLMLATDSIINVAKTMADRDNNIIKNEAIVNSPQVAASRSVNTAQLATSRQRAFAKLSKSSLNDKGYILGNEAAILKGIY